MHIPPKMLPRLWKLSHGFRLLSLASAAAGIASIAASLTFVWSTKHIVDIATGVSADSFRTAVAIMLAALAAQLVLNAAMRRVGIVASSRFSNDLRARLFHHMMHARWQGREPFHSADAIGRMAGDVTTVAGMVTGTLPGAVVTAVQLLAAFGFLLVLNARMAWILVVIMPVALAASKLYTRVARRLTRKIREVETEVNRLMQEGLRNRRLLLSLPEGGGFTQRFRASQAEFFRLILRRNDISLYASSAVTFGFMAGYTVAFLWCANGLMTGAVTFGVMTAFLQLVGQVQRPVVDLAGRVPQFVNTSVALERIGQLESLPGEPQQECVAMEGVPGVRLTDITYSYPDATHPAIDGLTRDFQPGSITAVAGGTGAGKTTLLMLLLGMVEPQKGTVELYSANGTAVKAGRGARCNMVYVPQGNSLIAGTVRENLLMADCRPGHEPSEAEMVAALHAACADFVMSLPDGLDTPTGEGGSGFSEGEAQRIAIARGLLGKGRVVVLDEPTSALDPATEQRLMASLREAAADRTLIIVTHREATMAACDSLLSLTPAAH